MYVCLYLILLWQQAERICLEVSITFLHCQIILCSYKYIEYREIWDISSYSVEQSWNLIDSCCCCNQWIFEKYSHILLYNIFGFAFILRFLQMGSHVKQYNVVDQCRFEFQICPLAFYIWSKHLSLWTFVSFFKNASDTPASLIVRVKWGYVKQLTQCLMLSFSLEVPELVSGRASVKSHLFWHTEVLSQPWHIVYYFWLVGSMGTGRWLCRAMTFFQVIIPHKILLGIFFKNSKKVTQSQVKSEGRSIAVSGLLTGWLKIMGPSTEMWSTGGREAVLNEMAGSFITLFNILFSFNLYLWIIKVNINNDLF